MIFYLIMAIFLPNSTYGYNELMCGNIGRPKPCSYGALTANGDVFDPNIASAAIPSPTKLSMGTYYLNVQGKNGCFKLRVNDKSNPRWINKRGFDLSPKAVELITGKRNRHWSGRIKLCANDAGTVSTFFKLKTCSSLLQKLDKKHTLKPIYADSSKAMFYYENKGKTFNVMVTSDNYSGKTTPWRFVESCSQGFGMYSVYMKSRSEI